MKGNDIDGIMIDTSTYMYSGNEHKDVLYIPTEVLKELALPPSIRKLPFYEKYETHIKMFLVGMTVGYWICLVLVLLLRC